MQGAKEELKSLTGREVLCGAYPFGEYDEALKREVSNHSSYAFTTQKRLVEPGQDPYLIPRIAVPKDVWSFLAIIKKFTGANR